MRSHNGGYRVIDTGLSISERFKRDIRQWMDDFKAGPSPEDYEAFLRRHLGRFKAHASFIVSPEVCGTLILTAPAVSGSASDAATRRVLTQDRFTAMTARLLNFVFATWDRVFSSHRLRR